VASTGKSRRRDELPAAPEFTLLPTGVIATAVFPATWR
jgi:hypothetical protein